MGCVIEKEKQAWRFKLQGENTGEATISDPLLDTIDKARERAESEFLKRGYAQISTSFKTYRSDLRINDAIKINGVQWLVKSISSSVDTATTVFTAGVKRYG